MLESRQEPAHQTADFPSYHDDADTDIESPAPAPAFTPQAPQQKRRRLLIIIAAVLLVVIIAGVVALVIKNKSSNGGYAFVNVFPSTLSLAAVASGTVQGNTYSSSFTANGSVAEIDVTLGQTVTNGQVLAKLNTTALDDALNVAKANLQGQKDSGANADAVKAAQYQVDTAQHNLDAATLKASHAGMVTAINGSVGGSSSGGSSTSPGFIQITDMSSLSVLLNVGEGDVGHVSSGNAVSFTVNAYRTRTFQATVATVIQTSQTVNNVLTFPVTLKVNAADFQGTNILPGMTVDATITTLTRSNVMVVPVTSISFAQKAVNAGIITHTQAQDASTKAAQMLSDWLKAKGPSGWQDEPAATFVLEEVNEQVVVKPVVIGLTDGQFYEVLSGLVQDDSVIDNTQAAAASGTGLPPTSSNRRGGGNSAPAPSGSGNG